MTESLMTLPKPYHQDCKSRTFISINEPGFRSALECVVCGKTILEAKIVKEDEGLNS